MILMHYFDTDSSSANNFVLQILPKDTIKKFGNSSSAQLGVCFFVRSTSAADSWDP